MCLSEVGSDPSMTGVEKTKIYYIIYMWIYEQWVDDLNLDVHTNTGLQLFCTSWLEDCSDSPWRIPSEKAGSWMAFFKKFSIDFNRAALWGIHCIPREQGNWTEFKCKIGEEKKMGVSVSPLSTCTWCVSSTALCSGVFWSGTWRCRWPRAAFHSNFWHWGIHKIGNLIILGKTDH